MAQTITITQYEIHGRSAGEDSRGYSFMLPACSNISEVTRGHYQGSEVEVTATIADGWKYHEADWFKVPAWGPGLESPSGKVYREHHATQAIEDGGLTLV